MLERVTMVNHYLKIETTALNVSLMVKSKMTSGINVRSP